MAFFLYESIAEKGDVERGNVDLCRLTVNTKYYLKETKAPQGYRIPVNVDGSSIVYEIYTKSNPENGTFEYYVNGKKYTSSSGDFAITGTKANRIVNLKVVNQIGLQLPDTGSHATLLLLVIGIGYVWLQHCGCSGKKEKRRKNGMMKNYKKSLLMVLAGSLILSGACVGVPGNGILPERDLSIVCAADGKTYNTQGGIATMEKGTAGIVISGNDGQSLIGKQFHVYKLFDAENAKGGESINERSIRHMPRL